MRKPYQVLSEMYSEINKATTPVKVSGKYIFFVQDQELYQLNPYKMIEPNGMIMTMASNWRKATVMQGEDVRDMLGNVDDIAAWYEVKGAPSDHTFEVYIGS